MQAKKKYYVVSKDEKSGLYYIHLEGYNYIPVFDSFRKTKRAAQALAKKRNRFL